LLKHICSPEAELLNTEAVLKSKTKQKQSINQSPLCNLQPAAEEGTYGCFLCDGLN